jgi:hypothetical protein
MLSLIVRVEPAAAGCAPECECIPNYDSGQFGTCVECCYTPICTYHCG